MSSSNTSSSHRQNFPIILQIGSRYIKAGFAGNFKPTINKNTNAFDLKRSQISPIGQSHAIPISNHPVITSDERGNILWSYDLLNYDSYELENLLERIIHTIYTRYLLIDSKKYKVLVIEPLFFPIQIKQSLTKVLLYHMHAKSVMFYNEAILSCIGSGSQCGIVVDLGWYQSTIIPVYDLRIIHRLAGITKRAGRLIHAELRKQFMQLDLGLNNNEMFQFVERFISNCCYCRDLRLNKEGGLEKTEYFQFEGKSIPSSLRYQIIESVLFQQHDVQDIDTQLITILINQLIPQLDIDLRFPLSQRIMFTGGLSLIFGVKQRIIAELQEFETSRYSDKIKGIQTLGPWCGASLYCSTVSKLGINKKKSDGDKKQMNELSRDKFLKNYADATSTYNFIDWSEALYNI